MKKNLFLLFSLYFFVVQPVFVWILRQEPNMLILGFINLVAILVILLVYKAVDSKEAKPHKEAHSKAAIHEEKETLTESHHHEPVIKKAPKAGKKGGAWKGFLGVILGIIFYVLFMGSSLGYKLIGASIIALVLLFLICLVSKSLRRFFSLAGTKILFIFLALGIIIFGYQFSFLTTNISLKDYVMQNVTASRFWVTTLTDNSDTYILSGEGSVIGSGTISGETTSAEVADLFSGMQGTTDVLTGTTTATEGGTTTTATPPTGVSLHMGEMLEKLLTNNNISLITKKDVKFTYVSYANELYPYFRTAYANALIGTTTNPSKLALCDTYIVMKGILAKWPVIYTKATVMTKFRDYAKANDKLNGCEKGAVLKDTNL